jgi:hypothetical protein
MKNPIAQLSTSKAAMITGVAFITSILIVSLVDDVLLANFVVPGDTAALARDIEANRRLFGFAVVGYLVVLALDSVIAIALYIVLKPASGMLALITAALRLSYACILAVGLFALVVQVIDVYGYAAVKSAGYVFFALHVFFLGYTTFQSGYIPRSIGVLLIIASFTYIVFFVDLHLSETVETAIMLTMAVAELSLCIWLMLKRNSLPANSD